jgi:hypothetical protein
MTTDNTVPKNKDLFQGNILLFYLLDVGDDIDLTMIKDQGLITIQTLPLSSYFKNYHAPLSFSLSEGIRDANSGNVKKLDRVITKLHHFGVISLCYRIPFHLSLEDLKLEITKIKNYFDIASEADALFVFEKIHAALDKPHFFNLKTSYFAIQVNPRPDEMAPFEFKEQYGSKIASLLRLEQKALSAYQKDEILNATIGYYGQDLIIIDGEGSFIYDDEYFEQMEFFECINLEKLELQYFDRLLDEELNVFYKQEKFKIPFYAYIPLIGGKVESPGSRLAKMRVDISVITERLENSIKIIGDTYYSRMYAILTEKLSIKEWRDSIRGKLDIIQDLYEVYQDRLDTIHGEILEFVIIILILFEIIMVVLRS